MAHKVNVLTHGPIALEKLHGIASSVVSFHCGEMVHMLWFSPSICWYYIVRPTNSVKSTTKYDPIFGSILLVDCLLRRGIESIMAPEASDHHHHQITLNIIWFHSSTILEFWYWFLSVSENDPSMWYVLVA